LQDWLDPLNTGVTAVAGSDPGLAILLITMTNLVPQLTIQSPTGITNQIQYSADLSQTQWLVLTNLLVEQSLYQVVDASAPPAPQRFYRVANTTTYSSVTLLQLWGNTGGNHLATDSIQQSSVPTPVNTSAAAFDAAHGTIWIPVSYVPNWAVGTQVFWGSSLYKMRVVALGTGQIQFHTLSGYFGWGPDNVITTDLSYTLSNAFTAATNWQSPGTGNTVVVTATAVSANVGDIVWAGGVGGDQFQVTAISH